MGQMAIKIDLEKAYDRLSWDFIRDTIMEVGLNQTWTRNLMHCIESSRMSILWDGTKLDWFTPKIGIRQGDPISPYIFVMCFECPSHIICKAIADGDWKGIKLSRHGPTLSHLFFTDDLILFVEASMHQLRVILDCLNRFCGCFGQRVHFQKS